MDRIVHYLVMAIMGTAGCREGLPPQQTEETAIFSPEANSKGLERRIAAALPSSELPSFSPTDSSKRCYLGEPPIHLDYNTIPFDQLKLEPINLRLATYIDDDRKWDLDQLRIPQEIEKVWLIEAQKIKDPAKQYLFLSKRREEYELKKEEKIEERIVAFEARLLTDLEQHNKSQKILADLSIKESLELVFYTTRRLLNFREVDEGRYKIRGVVYNMHGLDDQIASGVGDCNIFASTATHLFEVLKRRNKRITHLYVSNNHYGRQNHHDWTQIFFQTNGQLYVSSVDLSKDKGPYQINNSKGSYLSKNDAENRLQFYELLASDYECRPNLKPRLQKAYEEAKSQYRTKKDFLDFEQRIQTLGKVTNELMKRGK